MFRGNFQGANVDLKLWANQDWTGSSQDTGALAAGSAITTNSYNWGLPVNSPDSANDLLLGIAPYSLFFTAFSAKSFTLTLSNCQRSYFDIDRIFLGKYLEAPYMPNEGMIMTYQNNDTLTRTKGGSARVRPGQKWRDLKIDTAYGDENSRPLWADLMANIQCNQDVALSVFPGVGGRQERDYVMNAFLQAPSAFTWANVNYNNATYTFTEA
jgi:hypothetical protein